MCDQIHPIGAPRAAQVDVLIAGGGPAGLAVGVARGGPSVLVVHRDKKLGKPVRTSGGGWQREIDRLGVPYGERQNPRGQRRDPPGHALRGRICPACHRRTIVLSFYQSAGRAGWTAAPESLLPSQSLRH